MIGQFCAWCRGPHAERTRRDAKFCSKRCRQNSHSFGVRASTEASVLEQRRIAYADPPYPGLAHYYIERREVDHVALLAVLRTFDGWALSTSARAL